MTPEERIKELEAKIEELQRLNAALAKKGEEGMSRVAGITAELDKIKAERDALARARDEAAAKAEALEKAKAEADAKSKEASKETTAKRRYWGGGGA